MRPATRMLLVLVVAGCATTGDPGEGDKNLPNAGVGPFRKLTTEEVRGLAPYVVDDLPARYREPAVLADGSATLLFAVARVNGEDVIVRTRANDARTFFGTSSHFGADPAVVLASDQPWEGTISGPSLVRHRGEIRLYYAGEQGIGVARSSDGLHFTKEPGPLLTRAPATGGSTTWETTAPRAPSVFLAEDGTTFRMLYAAGNAIGEATSTDGLVWQRVGNGPVLVPALPPAPGSSLPNEKPPFDTAAVGDPCVVTRTTPAGRFQVRVLYTGTDANGGSAIGFAARYGDSGALERQRVPVYAVGQHEAAPALLDRGDSSYLYVQQDRREGTTTYPAIAAAIAPATLVLPETSDFPDAP